MKNIYLADQVDQVDQVSFADSNLELQHKTVAEPCSEKNNIYFR